MLLESPRLIYWLLLLNFVWLSGCTAQNLIEQPKIQDNNDLNTVVSAADSFSSQFPTEDILIVFDLDNTLLTMDSALGSVAWYDWQADMADLEGCQPGELVNRFAAQGLLYFLGSMQPVQDDTADIVHALQQSGYPVMVLTARGHDYYLSTLRELNRNNLSFDALLAPPAGQHPKPFTPPEAARPVRYQQGVLMVAGQHKGQMLMDLYSHLNLPLPKAVVMADDSLENLENMQTTLTQANIPYRLFRYSLADAKVGAFDAASATSQWQRLSLTLNDLRDVIATNNLPAPEQLLSCHAAD